MATHRVTDFETLVTLPSAVSTRLVVAGTVPENSEWSGEYVRLSFGIGLGAITV